MQGGKEGFSWDCVLMKCLKQSTVTWCIFKETIKKETHQKRHCLGMRVWIRGEVMIKILDKWMKIEWNPLKLF
jgi:hypothetical protein